MTSIATDHLPDPESMPSLLAGPMRRAPIRRWSEAGTMSPATLAAEIRTPLDSVNRGLQRLSIQRVTSDDQLSASPALIRQARSLAADLQNVVDQILESVSPDSAAGRQARQENVKAHDLLVSACDVLADYITPERVLIECPAGFIITTHSARVRQILVELLSLADRVGSKAPLRLEARDVEAAAEFEVFWVERGKRESDDPVDYSVETPIARALVRSLNGTLRFVESPLAGGRRLVSAQLHVPQQRAQDGIAPR
jgi:hypothetical protein